MRSEEVERLTTELNEAFTITCKKCGREGAQYYNDVRYYDYSGKVGSAGIVCAHCDNDVTLDD